MKNLLKRSSFKSRAKISNCGIVPKRNKTKEIAPIGGGGRTGRATGVHLHFETRFQNEPFNPRLAIEFERCVLRSKTLALNEGSYTIYYQKLQQDKKEPAKKQQQENQQISQQNLGSNDIQANVAEHIVKKGDTLYNISRRYGMTVDSLRKLNRLPESSTLQIGQKLLVKPAK